ncbi:L-seryl-tRNA(Sec) selenium transferase [Halanaerobium kushneri]|jgi:L-seryl-tRNA(Ser) seleniumtransferase|uniref:L-seryl-tRNA(Sec) selenium transferase n=1 Tax=Halanaerobium kushneri TaxID=56779 RepID=A0A1N6V1I3_9FIRM|nr:L-seryl-tRNA(Sec) selenium transferase [Halanaerobium kushneri]SIQ71707.1 L-seryl-tRNA(Sec) selenium transferase [Halanaerobium kushneri]
MQKKEILQSIPAVNDFLAAPEAGLLIEKYSRKEFLKVLREELNKIRSQIINSRGEIQKDEFDYSSLNIKIIINNLAEKLKLESNVGIKKAINATGVIIHTNLGRSVLAKEALNKVMEVSENYSTLELDLKSGQRGYRSKKVKKIFKDLTGAESAVVVNNNAAAVMLILTALMRDKEVVISRGEMVEIGGSFRIPEVMENSGAILKEVGSTNRVYVKDYLNAVSEKTGAFIKVHPSNYRIEGFTHSVKTSELVRVAKKNNLPVIEDLGSGIIFNLSEYGLPDEPTVKERIEAGIDILTFSGDKLLGGPQAGIIVGRKKYLNQIESHPMMRALRVDKMTLAALEETLNLYYNFDEAVKKIPTLKMITEKPENVKSKAQQLLNKIKKVEGLKIELVKTEARVGGGAFPVSTFDSYGLAVETGTKDIENLVSKLRTSKNSVIARIQADRAIFDLKTVRSIQLDQLAASINKAVSEVF